MHACIHTCRGEYSTFPQRTRPAGHHAACSSGFSSHLGHSGGHLHSQPQSTLRQAESQADVPVDLLSCSACTGKQRQTGLTSQGHSKQPLIMRMFMPVTTIFPTSRDLCTSPLLLSASVWVYTSELHCLSRRMSLTFQGRFKQALSMHVSTRSSHRPQRRHPRTSPLLVSHQPHHGLMALA